MIWISMILIYSFHSHEKWRYTIVTMPTEKSHLLVFRRMHTCSHIAMHRTYPPHDTIRHDTTRILSPNKAPNIIVYQKNEWPKTISLCLIYYMSTKLYKVIVHSWRSNIFLTAVIKHWQNQKWPNLLRKFT